MPGACGVAERVQLMTEGRNFRGVAIFASLKMTALRKVALAMEELAYEAGDAIVQRGDEGDAMYFVRSGSCSIDLGEGVPAPPDLTAGDFFGELSLLTEERRSATIVANDAVQALRLPKTDVKPILDSVWGGDEVLVHRKELLAEVPLFTKLSAPMSEIVEEAEWITGNQNTRS